MTTMAMIKPIAPHAVNQASAIPSPIPGSRPGIVSPNSPIKDAMAIMIKATMRSMIPAMRDMMKPAVAFLTGAGGEGGAVSCVCKILYSSALSISFESELKPFAGSVGIIVLVYKVLRGAVSEDNRTIL